MEDLNKYKDISLTNYEIFEKLNRKIRILTYTELLKYDNILDILAPNNCFIFLYMVRPQYGHWCACIKHDDRIEFFDPYGGDHMLPDEELKKIQEPFKSQSKQDFPYLTLLLYNSGYPIEYNNYNFQSRGNNIKTCGRQCIVRIMLKDIKLDQYYQLMTQLCHEFNYDYDDIVTLLTK